MPLIFDNGRIPTLWADRQPWYPAKIIASDCMNNQCLNIALINNMPDPALEDTELQFFELLDSVSGDLPIRVELYSLPNLPRGERAQQHLKNFYLGVDRLLNRHFDGAIITGTEPRQPNLQCEPYWSALAEVLDWAQYNTRSTVLSCLAAHASVLYSDGIPRRPLTDKQFGVFTYQRVRDHALTRGWPDHVRFPHSRWNEVPGESLNACGYSVLTQSSQAGVDLFVRKKKNSLFVHFQGHPEYGRLTLLKEFRRDIRRFLGGERATYPSMPQGYFDAPATEALGFFREKALLHREEQLLSEFPEEPVARLLENSWQSSAACIYENWLQYISSKSGAAQLDNMVRAGRA